MDIPDDIKQWRKVQRAELLARRRAVTRAQHRQWNASITQLLAEGFPNMLMVLGPHTARGNIPQAISHSVEFQAGMLKFMLDNKLTHVETLPAKVDEWTQIVIQAGEALLSSKVDSWQTGVNRNVDGRNVRRVLGYNGNGAHFRRTTDEVAKGGYKEFVFR